MRTTSNELKRAIGTTAILLGLGVIIMFYCDWRGTFAETIYVCRKSLWVLPAFAVVLSLLYYRQAKAEMFTNGKKEQQPRKVYLDYVRIMAAVFVILTHACSMQRGEDVAAWRICLLTICAGLGLVCNPLYVMISGTLLLSSKKQEPIGSFYYRRFVNVVIRMVVYYSIFLCVSGQMSFLPPKNLGQGFLQILAGESDIVPHYWLIYTLIALYMIAPFVKMVVYRLSDSLLRIIFWVILIWEFILTYLPLAGIQPGFLLNLLGWLGVFFAGYILTEKRTNVMEWAIIIAGAISAIIIVLVLLKDYALLNYVCNTAPTMVLFAGAIMILMSKADTYLSKKPLPLIQILSKYSYSIILVHWYGLFVVTWGKIGLQPLRFGCIGGIVLTVSVATLVCLVMGFVADNTIVFAVQSLFDTIAGLTRKSRRRMS